jgi:hypothetical protein
VTYTGLFQLRSAADLLDKLRHDYKRLEANPLDEFAAFDFFITAHHMQHDWLKGRQSKERKRYERDAKAVALRDVCAHIANGSKHFVADPARHDSVKDTQYRPGPFSQAFSEQFDISRLEIHLDGDAAKELGTVVWVKPLARQVLAFWEAHPSLQ